MLQAPQLQKDVPRPALRPAIHQESGTPCNRNKMHRGLYLAKEKTQITFGGSSESEGTAQNSDPSSNNDCMIKGRRN